jgi:RNA polymerase sigma-70 factor (sigma-E family)
MVNSPREGSMTTSEQSDFDSYVRGSGPRLKRLAYLLTGDLETAEDLLQSAYAKVLPHWGRVRRYEDPDAYVRRVMVSIRTSWWRRLRGREVVSADVIERPAGAGSRVGDDPADAAGDLDLALRALRMLPRRQQVAVVLRHYCDLSEAETARVMGITAGGVKSQASKGLATLRAAFIESPLDEEPTR